MAGTSSAKTRFALLPGHDGNYYQGAKCNVSITVEVSIGRAHVFGPDES